MKPVQAQGHTVFFESGLAELHDFLTNKGYSKIFVFADANTSTHCLPVFREMLDDFSDFDLIETDPGEENKNIDFCIGIWKTLLDFEADRKSLLINLGGGVITDMGGFVASTYKRGIDFINIPTTLLAQVDASVGGKTGIDIDHVKNMVGTFSLPQAVFIEQRFLETLPEQECLSGFAEIIKHGLIADADYYQQVKNTDFRDVPSAIIHRSVAIKNKVVLEDPTEKDLRKILNFGHTIGHAIESYSLSNDKKPLSHGEAIAIGMICESWLSAKYAALSKEDLHDISSYIKALYPAYRITDKSFNTLLSYMKSDKKNKDGMIMFSLLNAIGNCTYNCRINEADISESLQYYNNL